MVKALRLLKSDPDNERLLKFKDSLKQKAQPGTEAFNEGIFKIYASLNSLLRLKTRKTEGPKSALFSELQSGITIAISKLEAEKSALLIREKNALKKPQHTPALFSDPGRLSTKEEPPPKRLKPV